MGEMFLIKDGHTLVPLAQPRSTSRGGMCTIIIGGNLWGVLPRRRFGTSICTWTWQRTTPSPVRCASMPGQRKSALGLCPGLRASPARHAKDLNTRHR